MVSAAKKISQVLTHMAIAYALAYTVTGSAVFSGLAVLVEPVINVLLLPFHEAAWSRRRAAARDARARWRHICSNRIGGDGRYRGAA